MSRPTVLIFHRAPAEDDGRPLVSALAGAREELVRRQARLFERAGAADVRLISARPADETFGGALASAALAGDGGVIVLGSGAVPLLTMRDARRLVEVAASGRRRAMTNNRYSSDVCAIGRAAVLRDLPRLDNDNGLPRWLEEERGYAVDELPGRERLAMDLDSPLDVALVAGAHGAPSWLREYAANERLTVPRMDELRGVAADRRRELLVFGRSSAATLAWLEANVRCRVRFLAEERGLRAGMGLMTGQRPPRSALGLLLDVRGPGSLASIVGELAEGAIVDTRVLMAHRSGRDERTWPSPADRFASDLLLPGDVSDGWLRDLTKSAAESPLPILLGAHTLVGPGLATVFATGRHAN